MNSKSGKQTVRTFIAIRLPRPVVAYLAQQQETWRQTMPQGGVKWVDPALFHLTVRFLGQTHPDQFASLAGLLDSVDTGAFSLTLTQTGAFPNARRPRVLWAGVAGDLAAANALREQLDAGLAALGWPPDNHTFNPHITLGWVKRSHRLRRPPPLGEALEPLPIPVQTVWLVRSDSRPQGPVYTPVHETTL